MVALQITRSNARRFQIGVAAVFWLGSILACSQGYVTSSELTQTAQVSTPINTIVPATLTATASPSETPQPTLYNETSTSTSLPTFTEVPAISETPAPTNTINPNATAVPPIQYYTQSGDTLPSITGRFGVSADEIKSSETIPANGLINPGILLIIPDRLGQISPATKIMPDSEVVYSPSAASFDIEGYINNETHGYLHDYLEDMNTGKLTGAEVVKLVAQENSCNPYLLLAILEFKSHWVTGQPTNLAESEYPMGYIKVESRGLYYQLSWAVQQISIGYYGWRAGTLSELTFKNGTHMRINPELNAGSAAMQYLFAQWYDDEQEWNGALYGGDSMPVEMTAMFGDFWARSQQVEPLYPANLTQPVMELPFQPGETWSLTGGPHPAWGPGGALAALDFAPPSMVSGCAESNYYVTAMASGVITRIGNGMVIEDLDGDGLEETGWVIMYMHIETRDRVSVGTKVSTNDKIGHPSCEGGEATGTHTHIARKFNGEWMLAGGPVPFTMSGFVASGGSVPYEGSLSNGITTVIAASNSAPKSAISRPRQ
jgi:murein DD-endopeptidase MepM/ murein hydrolase activator NlpD